MDFDEVKAFITNIVMAMCENKWLEYAERSKRYKFTDAGKNYTYSLTPAHGWCWFAEGDRYGEVNRIWCPNIGHSQPDLDDWSFYWLNDREEYDERVLNKIYKFMDKAREYFQLPKIDIDDGYIDLDDIIL